MKVQANDGPFGWNVNDLNLFLAQFRMPPSESEVTQAEIVRDEIEEEP